jgi:hypothetical protein
MKEYVIWSGRAAVVHRAMQRPGIKSVPYRLGDLGTYPSNLMTSASVFDTYLHVRYDIATAVGATVRPVDPNALNVTLEWMMTGLGQMNTQSLSWLDRPVVVELLGPGGGTWTVGPAGHGAVNATPGDSQGAARVIGSAVEFPLWATLRKQWKDSDLEIRGDAESATRFLDGLRII